MMTAPLNCVLSYMIKFGIIGEEKSESKFCFFSRDWSVLCLKNDLFNIFNCFFTSCRSLTRLGIGEKQEARVLTYKRNRVEKRSKVLIPHRVQHYANSISYYVLKVALIRPKSSFLAPKLSEKIEREQTHFNTGDFVST